jgi:uncharacterized protein
LFKHRQTDATDPNPTSVSQTKFGAASTKEIHGFARTLEGTVDPKLLDILVCRISKDALEFGWTRQELISRAAKLAYPIHDGSPTTLPAKRGRSTSLAGKESGARRHGMSACMRMPMAHSLS